MALNRWVILGVLFLVRFALGYQFQAAGSVGPMLVRDLGIDWADLGMLVGAFMLPGLVVAVPGGFLGHRLLLIGFFRVEQRRLASTQAMTPSIAAVDHRA